MSIMQECPYCNSDLRHGGNSRTTRNGNPTGHKSTGTEYVSCPDCGGMIDGFSAH
ncbi:hypothetical protein SAMN05444342_0324 [Haladaptatus paucihalophilus DX253]|uniref:Uncharacterized protein n=2 Tax=Haladaptataceae TaxID=3064797 RepID=A0A1M6P417_HALPU|nr:hypothetical protein SAMN05444342_0324 [Haladaptatus paucihalophilus DX253]